MYDKDGNAVDAEINEEIWDLFGPHGLPIIENRLFKVSRSEKDENEFRASLARDVSPMEELEYVR